MGSITRPMEKTPKPRPPISLCILVSHVFRILPYATLSLTICLLAWQPNLSSSDNCNIGHLYCNLRRDDDDQREESDGCGVLELKMRLGTGRGNQRAACSVRPLSKVHHQKGNADSHGNPNPQSHADAHPYGNGETHTDRDAHPYANSETHRYGNSETYTDGDTHSDGDTYSDGDTDGDTQRYSHPSAERLSAIEFDWSAGAGHQC